jgi:hypothetical protein
MGEPPVLAGADQVITAFPLPGVATTFTGAPGAVAAVGITPVDAVDAAELPTRFVAITVNVYDVPFDNPRTVQVVVGAVATQVNPPVEDVTV